MDTQSIQPAIDSLNVEITRLTGARDVLQALTTPAQPLLTTAPTAEVDTERPKQKEPTASARSIGQQKRWAEQKRNQRKAK